MSSILVFDIGTTKIKAGLYDTNGEKIAESIRDSQLIFPAEGLAEQDPQFWLNTMGALTRRLLDRVEDVEALSVTGQMIGLIPVDGDLRPLGNAIIWLDSRAKNEAEEIMEKIPLMDFLEITGGIPSAKDVVSKILWLRNHRRDVFDKARYFLDVKDYIISSMTGRIVTDISTASVRGLVNIKKRDYSDEILEILGISVERLPEILPADAVVGEGRDIYRGMKVVNGSGDAFVTPFGAGAAGDGKVHYYLGTSGWASTHLGDYRINEERGIGSVLSVIPDRWLFISESESAGSCLDWFLDNVGLQDYSTVDEYSRDVSAGSGRLIFLPWLYGERSPVLDVYARGGFVNLSLSHNIKHLARAVLEGVAMNTRWMLSGIRESGVEFGEINAVGGGARSDVWMQILSDVAGIRVKRMEDPQNATMRGAAILSLIATGYVKGYTDADKMVRVERVFEPDENTRNIYDEIFEQFKAIYDALKGIFESLNYGGG